MSNEERSLAEIDTDAVEVEPGEMTAESVMSGARAMRLGLKARPNLHLFADMQRLVDAIEESPEDADVDDLIDEYDKAKAAYLTHEWWVIEQRTHERRTLVRRKAAKALGYALDELDRVEGDDDDLTKRSEVEAHVIADHVVKPEGLTADDMRVLHASSPGEFARLEMTVVQVQKTLSDEGAQAVLRDFSSRRSAKTKGSTKR